MYIPRPEQLFGLFAPVTNLAGVGAKMGKIMEKKIGGTVIDLLRHLPVSLNDRSARPAVHEAVDGQIATFEILVLSADLPAPRTNRPARIKTETMTGQIELIFFHMKADFLQKMLPVGEKRLISGRVEWYNGRLQMAHPDYILPLTQARDMPEIEPIYPLNAGLRAKMLRRAIEHACRMIPDLPEWIDADLCAEKQWPDFKTALCTVHKPQNMADLSPLAAARMRLAFDELFANQLALALLRQQMKQNAGQNTGKAMIAVAGGEASNLAERLIDSLPFAPTDAQRRVFAEIKAEQQMPNRMLRLLQGDVGAGKTLVALLAMLTAIESGYQTALLAPTEILARQHHTTLNDMLASLGIEAVLLTGGMKVASRRQTLDAINSGESKMIIGTHALLNDEVVFKNLGLAVVDEQHRFGVRQRLVLGQKGHGCDVLVMTATPIPRTLALTVYGDLAVSRLDEKPAHRRDIETAVISMDRLAQIIERIRHTLKNEQQDEQRIYWICPLVEDSDKLDISAAQNRYQHLQNLLPDASIALAHGRMKTEERTQAMDDFKSGASQILVATTVIEVGVDVPEASIMIIEHAERFGLAQLHQLRGRVGRGDKASTCILLYQKPLSETAEARLKIMRQTNDGFLIAEEDLRLRGPGEVLGQKQSGLPELCLADLNQHGDLIALARGQAETLLAKNHAITDEAMKPYAMLLSLFERDMAVKFLNSG